ncbi:MAG: hypothetical protein V3T22_06565, partial [Planctomycetota bacterium]
PLLWYYRRIAQLVAPPPGQDAVASYETYTDTRDLAAKVTFEDLEAGGAIICGTPDDCNRDLEKFEETYGFTDLLVWTRMGGLAPEKVMKSMDLMHRYVIPNFKDKTPSVGVRAVEVDPRVSVPAGAAPDASAGYPPLVN